MAASRAAGRSRTVVGCEAAVFGCEAATRRFADGRLIARVAELSTAGATAVSMATAAAGFVEQPRVATTVSAATAGGGASAGIGKAHCADGAKETHNRWRTTGARGKLRVRELNDHC